MVSVAATPKRDRTARLRRIGAFLREHYMQMDPRTAGLYRIVAGFLLCADALRHWELARIYYSNDGVLSNHWLLFKPPSPYHFSLFSAFSSIEEVHVAFALSFACYFCLFIGWHARLMAVLSFVWVSSMDSRLLLAENGGYVVVNLVAMYAIFLPIERRFSVDAWLRSWREHRERSIAELGARSSFQGRNAPYVSLAALMVVVNFALVYLFNVVNKSGSVWRRGDTVHFVLHIDRMVTGVAVFFRELLPEPLMKPASWLVLSLEAFLVFAILSHRGRRLSRPLAMLGVALLHTTFGVMMRLGPFAWFMIGWSMCLPTAIQWASVERMGRARARGAVVTLRGGSRLALSTGRVLARLDAYELLAFEEGDPSGALVSVRREGDLRPSSGEPDVARAIAGALPFGSFWWRAAAVASLGLLPRLPGLLERHAERLERWLFSRERVVIEAGALGPPLGPLPPSPLARRAARAGAVVREVFLGWMALCFALQMWIENKAIPPVLKPPQPEIMKATTHRFRTLQGWGMFSPNPIQEDGILSIDAYTKGGRRIDPLTGAPPVLDLGPVRGAGLGQIPQDYGNRIRSDRNEVYRKELEEFLRRWHLVTGRPEDEIVAFDVYWVMDKCPAPGSDAPTENKAIAIRSWRMKGWRQPPGHPPIPPQPKIESAGK